MRLLALETSTRRLSVALFQTDACLCRSADAPNGGSGLLLPWVHELLAEAGLTLAQVDGIAFGAGPGSFTGLRLAAGCAQGLAFGLDRPVIGIGSLAALAFESGEKKVFACVDARMNEVYAASYEEGVETAAPVVLPPEQVTLPPGEGWVGCGDGFSAYGALPRPARVRADLYPTAAAVAALAAPLFARGEGRPAVEAVPLYVRDKVALTTAERLARGGLR